MNDTITGDGDEEALRLSAADDNGGAGRACVSAEGEIDLYTVRLLAPVLSESFARALSGGDGGAGGGGGGTSAEAAGTPTVVLDLRRVTFIDSAALALFTGFYTEYRERCRLALLVTERGQPERALQLAHLHTVLPVVHSARELDAAGAPG